MHPSRELGHVVKDIFIVVGSIVVAIILVQTEAIDSFVNATGSFRALSAIVAGAFFTSIFTLAPAAVGLVSLGEGSSPIFIAAFGALGGMCIDIIITIFIRKEISRDLENLSRFAIKRHLIQSFHFGFLKWVVLLIGLFFVATPLPDELGLFFLGLSKIKMWALPFIFYLAHFAGIYALIIISQAVI